MNRATLKKDLLIAGLVAIAVFVVVQTAVISVGWWYRDTPFPSIHAAITQEDNEKTQELGKHLHAELHIPSNDISIPIVWSSSTSEEDLQNDLERGAIHYPGTALPGLQGNAFISAHSSDFFWKKGMYKYAFARLNDLVVGDEMYVAYSDGDTPVQELQFRVTEKRVVAANDSRLFEQSEKKQITLVTCWPIGTNWWRLMVQAELVEN